MVPGSRERGRGRGRDDSECLLATPTTPALVRDTRRVSELRTGMRCARCVCGAVVLASRPRAASNGHRSGGYQMLRRSDSGGVRASRCMLWRALATAGGAAGPAAGECILVAYVGCRFGGSLRRDGGRAARRWRPEQGQRRLLGSAPREQNSHHDEDGTLNLNSTRKTAGNLELSPARGPAPPRRDTSAPRKATNPNFLDEEL